MNPVNSNNSYWSMIKPYALLSNFAVPTATAALHLLSSTSVEALRTVANGAIVLLSGTTAAFAFHDMAERGVQEDNVTAAAFGVTVLAAKIIGDGTQILAKKLAEVRQEKQELESKLQKIELTQNAQEKIGEKEQEAADNCANNKEETITPLKKNREEIYKGLNAQIEQKDQKIRELQSKIEMFKEQEQKFLESQKTLEALQKELEQAKTEKEGLQAEKDSILNQIERLYKEEVKQATELSKQEETIRSLQEELKQAKQLQKTLNDTVKDLESNNPKTREENDAASTMINFSLRLMKQTNNQAPPPPPPPPSITKNSSEKEFTSARNNEQVQTHIKKLEKELGELKSVNDIDNALRRLSNTETKTATALTMINKQLTGFPEDLKNSLLSNTPPSEKQKNSLTASVLGQSFLKFDVNDPENLLNKRIDLEYFILAIKFKIEDLQKLLKQKTSELSKKKTQLLDEITNGIVLKATPQVEKPVDPHSQAMAKIKEAPKLKPVQKQELTEEEEEAKRNQSRDPLLVAIEGFRKNGNTLKKTEVNAHRPKTEDYSLKGVMERAITAKMASLRGDSDDDDDDNDDDASVWGV